MTIDAGAQPSCRRLEGLALLALIAIARIADGSITHDGPEFQVNTYTYAFQGSPAATGDGAGFVIVWHGRQGTPVNRLGILGQRYNVGGITLGMEFVINTIPLEDRADELYPEVARLPTGGFVVVWEGYDGQDGSEEGIFGQRFASTGEKVGTEFQVNSYTSGKQKRPQVAAGPDEPFIVVWTDDSYRRTVIGQRYDSGGSPLGGEFQVATYTTGMAYDPRIAIDNSGNLIIVWQSLLQDGSDDGVFARTFTKTGDPIGLEFQINSYTTGNQQHPDIAHDDDGRFLVVWDSFAQDGSGEGIFGRHYNADLAPISPEFQINAYTTGRQARPRVTAVGDDDFVVIWSSEGQDGDSAGVFARTVNLAEGTTGPEIQVNTYTTGPQGLPARLAVAAIGENRAVIAWEGSDPFEFGQDGSGSGIFAQRVCVESPLRECGDATCAGDAAISASDALVILRAAVGLSTRCKPCVCDTDNSGAVTARDALAVLHYATSKSVVLGCPPCS